MSKDSSMHNVLMVCTGNTCRSPMAAGLARLRLGENSMWRVDSAGLAAGTGYPASAEAIAVMREVGVELSGHRSKRLSEDDVRKADVILVMTSGHQRELLRLFPWAQNKVFLTDSFGLEPPMDVDDPIGGSVDVYRMCRDQLDRAIGNWVLHLAEAGCLKRK